MPGIVDMFCNQAATWEKKIPGKDIDGNPEYEAPVDIRIRFVRAHKTHQTEPGNIVVTTRSVLTKDKIQTGDMVTCDGERFEIRIGPNEAVWINGVWWGAFCFG